MIANMRPTTALFLLKSLARMELLETRATTFVLPPWPEHVHGDDVFEAFVSLSEHVGFKRKDLHKFSRTGLVVYAKEVLFHKLYDLIFVKQKLRLYPDRLRSRSSDTPSPLPSIFIGREKTQVRQIPLADRPPWPFHFLMELGGMIVVRARDRESLFLELRQYLNNHPQFELRVDAKDNPDGSLTIFTYWFKELKLQYRKENFNVPH